MKFYFALKLTAGLVSLSFAREFDGSSSMGAIADVGGVHSIAGMRAMEVMGGMETIGAMRAVRDMGMMRIGVNVTYSRINRMGIISIKLLRP
ncbi:unnamed protein product [Enterobius vermicularis]|uniref:Antifreeze protein n=1 Tax=Enterobius vermicularis TaxID=51028 RepID=A0A0N4V2Z3_ENTVE|nr:unnamed protein product [Enterobius vermicularis]